MALLMLDLDDTLVVRRPVIRAWADDLLAEHDLRLTADHLGRLDFAGPGGHEEFHAILAAAGYTGPVADVARFSEEIAARYVVADAAWAALRRARSAGWLLAVVTNGPTERQTTKLRAAGLDTFVDAVCISEEVGVAKPDPLIFETAAQRAGCTLDGAWMVGDNVGADVVGAHRAGVRAALVQRADDWLNADATEQPDLTAVDVADAIGQILAHG